MKKTFEPRFDETYYTETLENGLKLVIWHKPLFTATSCIFATPYGALDYSQTTEDGTIINDPAGIAHFLEHKMFECSHGDVMTDFSEMGANVNAFTSYTETCYTFSTCQKDIAKPLNLLLDFVQELSITDQSVEKEKGIICQELAMYQQMPDSRLFNETFKALYALHPLNEDIGGSSESVMSTSRTQLENCYKRNYHPSCMTLVIVTPIDPLLILEIVKENQSKKLFDPPVKVYRTPCNEQDEVCSTHHIIEMDVSTPKVSLAYKFKPILKSDKDRTQDEWEIRCLLESHFSSLNPDYQTWIDQDLINDYFFYEVDFGKDYAMMMFVNETDNPSQFKAFIEEQLMVLKDKGIGLEVLNQLKKRYAGQAMRLYNSPDDIASITIKGLFTGVDYFSLIRLIESLNQHTIKETFAKLDFHQSALIEINSFKNC